MPVPLPDFVTVKVNVFNVKLAVTDLAASIVTEQGPAPEQAPLQPVKSESSPGVAVRETRVLIVYVSEQSAPQLIPAGLLTTVPVPVPLFARVRPKV
ncbi:hypothetical protein MNODULE_06175 [Nitrospiraceae bacterium HYJII51-Mn-bac16s-1-B09]|uniref:Uncharacterized protein n=1 Tax=Candidatus Manganitrophus noduliformans TaxID=2606439 RepID=A0A7X6IAB8_9BACT|nr:hypothetical protein [Candidatus Manganitrophus noduliformans]